MAKKYRGHNGALHSYEFYQERKNDPMWHDDFIEVRRIKRRTSLVEAIVVVALVVFGVGMYGIVEKNKQTPAAPIASSSSSSAQSESSKEVQSSPEASKESSQPQKQETGDSDRLKSFLTGKSYKIVPILYDGINANQAAHTNKAPQNFVENSIKILNFVDETTVTTKSVNGGQDSKENYQVSDSTLTIGSFNVPYQMHDNDAEFKTWTSKDQDGHTVTWKMEPYHENNQQHNHHHDHD
ncbi:hypothetical protein [Xylocopilactobacillus apicola]|uniref:DUF5067 domain-containing protein n=1 Tax=Xylocopilactobacillus apicola TaxID=2932184 RepID=A0AAU9DSV0_9LACO|nr:hypothetical protein [Xylocopilactobacillus apicola]BDR59164.1 hypothetical protein XA3_16050 [Xylocopilactobacillus apicola]